MTSFYRNDNEKLKEVTKENPCPHCNKPDWCYRLGEITVCNREQPPVSGWYKTSKKDKEGKYYYAPVSERKPIAPKTEKTYYYPDREGDHLVQITRTDDGKGNKKFSQRHFDGDTWHNNLDKLQPEQCPIYRYQEIREAIAQKTQYIFLVEGEKCADKLWDIGLAATTTKQGLALFLPEHLEDLKGAKRIVLCPDRDRQGLNKMLKLNQLLTTTDKNIAWLLAPPSDFFWSHLPDSKGLDVANWIESGASAENIIARISYETPIFESEESETKEAIATETNFTQKAYNHLYGSDSYISINSILYKWNGKYYQKISEPEEKKRIALWCGSFSMAVGKDRQKFSLANTRSVEEIYKWAVVINSVDPANINPAGINCSNGVVTINWIGKVPQIILEPHNPKRYYTYCSDVVYNQNADPGMCDRLLAALEPPQRNIFLKVIAASLDLKQVRKVSAVDIKALLLQGTGSNGKDSLWQAVSCILGDSMTQISLSDFKEYDSGRKFNVARLENASICWASENSEYVSLDNLQVLKQAITSEQLTIEQKNAPAYLAEINSVFLFNVNQAPLINGGLEAIKRRYAVLNFDKTYCKDAKEELGQLEADPRFRYDREFLTTEIAPALLNYLIGALYDLVKEGIDYSCTEEAMNEVKKQSNHLWEFVEEIGLVLDPNGQVYLQDIWEQLKQWYIDNEILTVENGRNIWQQPIRKGDDYVKASRNLFVKLQAIYPQIGKAIDTTKKGVNKTVIYGVAQLDRVKAKLRLNDALLRDAKATKANYQYYSEMKNIKTQVNNLTKEQRLELQYYLTELISHQNEENAKANDDFNLEAEDRILPSLPSPPPPSGLQPSRLPSRLPSPCLSADQNDPLLEHSSITKAEAYKSKIEFVFSDSNECFEVGKIVRPYLYVRKPGTRDYITKKLIEFERVQIGKTIYRLER